MLADHGIDGGDYAGHGYAGQGRGHGRGRGFRGRGRGYGSGDTHQELDGYEYNVPKLPPRQRRGELMHTLLLSLT